MIFSIWNILNIFREELMFNKFKFAMTSDKKHVLLKPAYILHYLVNNKKISEAIWLLCFKTWKEQAWKVGLIWTRSVKFLLFLTTEHTSIVLKTSRLDNNNNIGSQKKKKLFQELQILNWKQPIFVLKMLMFFKQMHWVLVTNRLFFTSTSYISS